MDKIFKRTENGTTTFVSIREGLNEANHAMMDGKRDVKTMSAGSGRYDITYKDGRHVVLIKVDAPAPEGFTQGQAVVVQRPGQLPRTGTVAHIHTAPGYVAVLDDRNRSVSNYPARFVSAAEVEEEPQEWGTTTASTLVHKFHGEGPATTGADYRAKCNRGIRWYARPLSQTEGPRLRTRTEVKSVVFDSGDSMYRFCPRCEAK